jgi:hypothetical protein
MIIKKVWLKTCQFFAQDRRIRARKLKIGPGMTGKIQPIMPARAKINPITMITTSKLVAYFFADKTKLYLNGPGCRWSYLGH